MKIVIQQLTAGSGTATVTAPSAFTFVAITNTTPADIKMAPGKAVVQPTDAFDYPAGTFIGFPLNEQQTSVTLFWSNAQAGNLVTVYFSDVPFFTPGNVGSVSVNVVTMPSVNISGGTVSLSAGTTVGISGTVTINGSVSVSNTPSVNINSAGNTVSLAANTSVSITGTVTISGTVNIGNSPTVSISGTGNTVSLAANTSVNIGNTPNVNISGGTVNATIQNASISTNVLNSVLQTNTTQISTAPQTSLNFGSGGGTSVAIFCNVPEGFYDTVTCIIHSANGSNASYTVQLNQLRLNGGDLPFGDGRAVWNSPINGASANFDFTGTNADNAAYTKQSKPMVLSYPMAFTSVVMYVSATVAITDTVTIECICHKASVSAIVSTVATNSNITNTTGSSANMQPGQGSFDNTIGTNGGTFTPTFPSGNTVTIVASGNYVKKMHFGGASWLNNVAASGGATISLTLYLGSQVLATVSTNIVGGQSGSATLNAQDFDFGSVGVSNAGFTLKADIPSGGLTTVNNVNWSACNGVGTSATPPSRVGVVV